jgi:hypothetical protein
LGSFPHSEENLSGSRRSTSGEPDFQTLTISGTSPQLEGGDPTKNPIFIEVEMNVLVDLEKRTTDGILIQSFEVRKYINTLIGRKGEEYGLSDIDSVSRYSLYEGISGDFLGIDLKREDPPSRASERDSIVIDLKRGVVYFKLYSGPMGRFFFRSPEIVQGSDVASTCPKLFSDSDK